MALFRRLTAGGRAYVWLVPLALVLGALSLLYPSTPSYDPWSWILWGRELIHGQLALTNGPSWKPLPMLFTVPLALFGSSAPNLWLLVARAGAALSVILVFGLTARLTWQLITPSEPTPSPSRTESAARLAPALAAGAIAAIGLVFINPYLNNSLLGYSEGLTLSFGLIALARLIDGHPRQAFVLGFFPGLDRPEVWLLWLPLGLWLLWKDPSARGLVLGLVMLAVALWLVPPALAGDGVTGSANRALHLANLGSAKYAACPLCTELKHVALPLVLTRIKVVSALVILVSAWRLWRGRRNVRLCSGWSAWSNHDHALVVAGLTGVFGYAWFVLIAIETQLGFAGNTRYLVIGSAFIYLCAGVGFGWAAGRLAHWVCGQRATNQSTAGGVGPLRAQIALLAAAVLAVLVFLYVPGWVSSHGQLISLGGTRRAQRYQSQIREDLVALVKREGGATRIKACGRVMAETLQGPMVAWYLHTTIAGILDDPVGAREAELPAPLKPRQWPNVIFQVRPLPANAGVQGETVYEPSNQRIADYTSLGGSYRETHTERINLFQNCRR